MKPQALVSDARAELVHCGFVCHTMPYRAATWSDALPARLRPSEASRAAIEDDGLGEDHCGQIYLP